jgi:hypothetical protein
MFEPLEAKHLLSAVPGMESNWILPDAGVQVASGPDGFVYTARMDAGTYYLTRYDAAGDLDLTFGSVGLFSGDGLVYPMSYGGRASDFLYIDDGGINVGGTFNGSIDFTPTIPDDDLVSSGDTDVFIARFNSAGAYEWSQRFGGPDADSLVAVDVDSSGDLIATGSFEGTATFHTGQSLTSTINKDTAQFVFKLDASPYAPVPGTGDPVWYRQLQDRGELDVWDVEVSDTDDLFVVARAGRVTINGERLRQPSTLVVKMDGGAGDIDWVHRVTQATNPRGGIVQGPSGELYVAGTFTGTADFGDDAGALTVQSWEGYWDVYIVRIDDGPVEGPQNVWARQFACTQYLFPQGIAVVGGTDPTLVVVGQFLGTTQFDYPSQESGVLTVRQEEASISTQGYDAFLVEMRLDGVVEPDRMRVRQLGGTGADTYARLAAHPQIDAYNVMLTTNPSPWNQDPDLYDGIVHTPGGSAENLSGVSESVLVHVNRQAPQLEVVHVFDASREEVVSAVEEGRLKFRANVDGMPAAASVSWTVDDVGDPNTSATLALPAGSLDLGRHSIHASVTEDDITSNYTYIFDVTPNAPTNLAAAYANGVMTLTWQDNSNSPTATEETRFEIARRWIEPSVDWRDWEVIVIVDHDDPNPTSFVDNTVEQGETYEYVVRSVAVTDDGEIQSPAVERLTVVAEQGVLPVVSIEATDANAAESGLEPGMFTVSRIGTSGVLLVDYVIEGTSTATNGEDYELLFGQVTIPDGSVSATIHVVPIDDFEQEGTETVVLTLQAGSTYAVNGADSTATVSIADDDLPTIDHVASDESTIYGSVTGDLTDTIASDDDYEAIQESLFAGNKRSRLEHQWTFNVTSGSELTFSVEAHVVGSNGSNAAEDFRFEYSTDGSSWVPMITIDRTETSDVTKTSPLPGSATGTVYVRVQDTDRSKENQQDTIFVDQMFIRSEGTSALVQSPVRLASAQAESVWSGPVERPSCWLAAAGEALPASDELVLLPAAYEPREALLALPEARERAIDRVFTLVESRFGDKAINDHGYRFEEFDLYDAMIDQVLAKT